MKLISEKFLSGLLFAGVCLALFSPVVKFPVLYPYSFDKAIFFQIIVEFLTPFWVLLISRFPKYRPRTDFINLAVFSFLAVLLVSAIFGYDFPKSFWGYEQRMTGIFTMIHLLLFFLILRSLFIINKNKKRLVCFSSVVCFFISAAAVLEYYFPSFAVFISGINPGRPFSFLGNSIVLSAYILPHIFLNLYLLAVPGKKMSKVILVLFFVISIWGIYCADARGAVVGLAAGALLMLVLFLSDFFIVKEKQKKIFYASALPAIFFAMIFLSFFANKIKFIAESPLVQGTIATRFMLWDIAKQGIAEHPVLGWGPENFDLIYDKFYNPQFLNYSYYETWSDRAHNLILEIFANSGVLGFLAYLAIFFAVFWMLGKEKTSFKRNIFAGFFLAYFAQNLFAFDSFVVLIIFYLLLALVSAPENKKDDDKKNVLPRNGFAPVFYASLCFSFLGIVFLNIKPLIASNFALKSQGAFGISNTLAEDYFRKSKQIWNPYSEMADVKFANAVYLSSNEKKIAVEEKERLLALAIKEIKNNALKHPYDFSHYFLLGNLYTAAERYDLAYEEYEKALELSPKRHVVYFQYASAKFLEGKNDEAVKILRTAVKLDEKVGLSHWRLGLGLLNAGQNEEALKEAIDAIKLGHLQLTGEEVQDFAAVYIKDKRWSELVLFYELLIKSNSGVALYYAQLSAVYAETGEKEKARDAALKAAELDPSFREDAEIFIKNLGL
jgi:O-antigen ligase/Flp pilus assembly protein TadD